MHWLRTIIVICSVTLRAQVLRAEEVLEPAPYIRGCVGLRANHPISTSQEFVTTTGCHFNRRGGSFRAFAGRFASPQSSSSSGAGLECMGSRLGMHLIRHKQLVIGSFSILHLCRASIVKNV